MSTHVKSINFLIYFTILILLITCMVSSCNVLFSVFGGIFASAFVVLLLEVVQYHFEKRKTEDQICFRMIRNYISVAQINCALQRGLSLNQQLSDMKQIISSQLLDFPVENVLYSRAAIETDYTPWTKKNRFAPIYANYWINTKPQIESFQRHLFFIQNSINEEQISIYQDEIKILETQLQEHTYGNNQPEEKRYVTVKSPKVERALIKLLDEGNKQLDCLSSTLYEMDSVCNNRYNWKSRKAKIDAQCEQPLVDEYQGFME